VVAQPPEKIIRLTAPIKIQLFISVPLNPEDDLSHIQKYANHNFKAQPEEKQDFRKN
jgi:hypothetical protein